MVLGGRARFGVLTRRGDASRHHFTCAAKKWQRTSAAGVLRCGPQQSVGTRAVVVGAGVWPTTAGARGCQKGCIKTRL